MRIDYPDLCIFHAAYGDELDGWTRDGWRVVAAFPEDRIKETRSDCQGGQSYGEKCEHGFDSWHKLTRTDVLRTTVYLLAQYRDQVVDDLRDKIRAANQEYYKVSENYRKAEASREELAKDLAKSGKDCEALTADCEALRQQRLTAETAKSKLERDLAKIRKSIGTKAYDEIVK
jgi:hypothetical protein